MYVNKCVRQCVCNSTSMCVFFYSKVALCVQVEITEEHNNSEFSNTSIYVRCYKKSVQRKDI